MRSQMLGATYLLWPHQLLAEGHTLLLPPADASDHLIADGRVSAHLHSHALLSWQPRLHGPANMLAVCNTCASPGRYHSPYRSPGCDGA